MTVTLTTHSVTAPYTATDFATKIRLAFIDAGWMTDWHASFTDGTRLHRVMKIDHDNTKTYGTTYYWFVFDGADMFFHITRTWDTGTNVPTGTQYLDFLSTSKTVTTNHMRFATQNANTSVQIRVYRSQTNSNFAVIYIKNGTTDYNLILDKGAPVADLVDLTKTCYQGLMWARTQVAGRTGSVRFQFYPPKLRGSHLGAWMRDATSAALYGAGTAGSPWEPGTYDAALLANINYAFPGNATNDAANINLGGLGAGGNLVIRAGFTNTNPAHTSNYNPVWYNVLLSNYSALKLPDDFIIAASYISNTNEVLGTATVDGITYQFIRITNGAVINDSPSPYFAAAIS